MSISSVVLEGAKRRESGRKGVHYAGASLEMLNNVSELTPSASDLSSLMSPVATPAW